MKHLTTFALALLAVSALSAEDVRFGAQATITKPSGDLGGKDWMDSKLGYGVGVHTLFDLGGGAAIVPRIDYTVYKNDQSINALINQDAKARILSAGADFHFYVGGNASQGFYLLGGLGYARGQFDSSYSAGSIQLSAEGSKDAVYFQGGVGLNFTPNIGVECRYQSLKFSDVETSFMGIKGRQSIDCPSLQASLVLRF